MATILIVEDNELNRDMLSRRLRRRGFTILLAETGEEGLTITSAQRPDLILMDISLPGLDGWDVTRRIKADDTLRTIPIIALTAHAMPTDRQKSLAAGCDDYDTKPIDLNRLLTKIEALVRSQPEDVQVKASRFDAR
ncbi:MAG: response regulator [Anaerolineae bacterium]|jgi:CheY-like chemotaxis protein